MSEFISESIIPADGAFETAALARAEPGLPPAFEWRGERHEVRGVVERWRSSSREGGRVDGELYLRRHYFKLSMSDGRCWTVYCLRQAGTGRAGRRRWFLQTKE